MELERAQKMLSEWEYKPGANFSISRNAWYWLYSEYADPKDLHYVVQMTMPVVDAINLTDKSTVVCIQHLKDKDFEAMSEEDFTKYFFEEIIMRCERHEAEEFFRKDGESVYDPHPEVPPHMKKRRGPKPVPKPDLTGWSPDLIIEYEWTTSTPMEHPLFEDAMAHPTRDPPIPH